MRGWLPWAAAVGGSAAAASSGAGEVADRVFEIRRVQSGRRPLGPDQVFFKPCLVYQTLFDDHVVDAGLDLQIDMTTGVKRARFGGGGGDNNAESRRDAILERQRRVIADDAPHATFGDGPRVLAKLANAAAWGDAAQVAHILETCYVTRAQATRVLYDVAGRGASMEVLEMLLDAGADPGAPLGDGRTALHAACAGGHEALATRLVDRMAPDAADLRTAATRQTAMDLLRANDFGPAARRLDKRLACHERLLASSELE